MRNQQLYRLLVLCLGTVLAVSACKKPEPEPPPPVADAPPPPEMQPEAPATPAMPALMVSSVTVGNAAAADKSVAPMMTLGSKDTIIVSIKTDGEASNANVSAKLTYQDGQVAGEQGATLNTHGSETTNIEFSKPDGWPAGKYTAEARVDGQPAGTPQQFEVK